MAWMAGETNILKSASIRMLPNCVTPALSDRRGSVACTAMAPGNEIIFVSPQEHMFRRNGTQNGFGREVERFIEIHGYRWRSDGTRPLPPTK